MKPQVVRCSGSRAACMPDQPPRYAYVPGSDQEGLVPAAATAGLARRTEVRRGQPIRRRDGDGRRGGSACDARRATRDTDAVLEPLGTPRLASPASRIGPAGGSLRLTWRI